MRDGRRSRPHALVPGRGLAALALLAAAAGLAFLPPTLGHLPNTSGEAAGNPSGLAGITFLGPAGTSIANTVCPPILDGERPLYGSGQGLHIGHLQGINGPGGTTANYVAAGTVDLWHFEDDPAGGAYSSPRAIEGPHAPGLGNSIMMGADGFMRGKMQSTVRNGPGTDFTLTDVHDKRTYCVYGAIAAQGPYLFVHATEGDVFGASIYTDLDLAWFYAALFAQQYPGQAVSMDYIFLVSSAYNDPPPPPPPVVQVALTCLPTDANAYDQGAFRLLATGNSSDNTWLAYHWEFGDGTEGDGASVHHRYEDDGVYTVRVTASTPTGGSATATGTCVVNNRPPVAYFACPQRDESGRLLFVGRHARDPEGPIAHYAWDFGDGSAPASGFEAAHAYAEPGEYAVTLTVFDNDWQSQSPTRLVTSNTTTIACNVPPTPNRPPVLERIPPLNVPLGAQVAFTVHATDPDGDKPLTYAAAALPPDARFDPASQLFTWDASRLGLHKGLRFSVSDPGGLSDVKEAQILVYTLESDADMDGIADVSDVCPAVPDHDQRDTDGDGKGDACETPVADAEGAAAAGFTGLGDPDADGDGVADFGDVCPRVADAAQADLDGDGKGDLCDADVDDDGIPQAPEGVIRGDNCPRIPNPGQEDLDRDGVGDACGAAGAGAVAPSLPAASAARQMPAARAAAATPLTIAALVGTVSFAAVLCGIAVAWRRFK